MNQIALSLTIFILSFSVYAGGCRVLSQDTTIKTVSIAGNTMIINKDTQVELESYKRSCGLFGRKVNNQKVAHEKNLRISIDDCYRSIYGFSGNIVDETDGYRITSIVCY